jgi:hypothetical protein
LFVTKIFKKNWILSFIFCLPLLFFLFLNPIIFYRQKKKRKGLAGILAHMHKLRPHIVKADEKSRENANTICFQKHKLMAKFDSFVHCYAMASIHPFNPAMGVEKQH